MSQTNILSSEDEPAENCIELLKSNFDRVARQIKPLFDKLIEYQLEYKATNAPNFNIYRILRLHKKEVTTHSPMLAHLLDPDASHGQGFLFLNSLIEYASTSLGLKKPNGSICDYKWYIELEKQTQEHGRMDIVISCEDLNYLLVIENKIGSSEHSNQLLKYRQWMEQQQGYTCRQLIFLTPKGRRPKSYTSDNLATKTNHNCICLSYHKDVYEILSKTVKQIKAKRVRETVKQYIEIVKTVR